MLFFLNDNNNDLNNRISIIISIFFFILFRLLVVTRLDYVHHYSCNESYVRLMRELESNIYHGSYVKQ